MSYVLYVVYMYVCISRKFLLTSGLLSVISPIKCVRQLLKPGYLAIKNF